MISTGSKGLGNIKTETIFRELWKREFQLNVETFQFVVNVVKNDMEDHNIICQNSIAVEK